MDVGRRDRRVTHPRQESVTDDSSSPVLPRVSSSTSGSTRSATRTRRVRPLLVTFPDAFGRRSLHNEKRRRGLYEVTHSRGPQHGQRDRARGYASRVFLLRAKIVPVIATMLISLSVAACTSSTSPAADNTGPASPTAGSPATPPTRAAVTKLRVPSLQAGELARATLGATGQVDVLRRAPGPARYAVHVACLARRSTGTASYVVYDTDSTRSRQRKLSSGSLPCDGTQTVNSLGRLHTSIQIAFSEVPPHTSHGYAIVVPER